MNVIIIPCSGRKISGGQTDFKKPPLAVILGNRAFKNLLEARNELAGELGLKPGPDIQDGCKAADMEFRPAFERYSGIMYRKAEFQRRLPVFQGKIFIISALYGLLDASDLIRDYNLQMSDSLPSGEKVWKWWKDRGLGTYLEIALSNSRATEVYDLLSQNYRKALGALKKSGNYKLVSYDYPGLGTGSLYHRGEDLKKLLSNR
jgi:cytoplasmic iron level regulating protein YaaA (DUF328/UPF0246 family)